VSAVLEQFEDLPFEMREALRWLLWQSVPVPGKKPRKVPYYANGQPRHGALDTAADQKYLVTFDDACAKLKSGKYTGLGFALGPDGSGNYWQGVDLDGISDRPELAMLAEELPGYTETSPSGKGIHAIGYGRAFQALGSNSTGIEAYSAGRYFTVTADGAGLNSPTCIADFVERVLRPRHSPAQPTQTTAQVLEYIDPKTITELRSALSSMRADDRDSWIANGQRLKKLGERGRALWLEWSQQSDKYDPADAARVWDSFSADHTGYQAIFKAAQQSGWLNPMSGSVPSPSRAPVPSVLSDALETVFTTLTDGEIDRAAEPYPHAFMGGLNDQSGLFPEGEVTVIGAPGREGKTSVMMAIVEAYVLGRSLGGLIPVEVKAAVIYSAEDDRRQYARKMGAHRCRMTAVDSQRFQNSIYIPDLHGPDMAAWREIVKMEQRQPVRGSVVEPLIAKINAIGGIGLVVFETASTLSDAEEDNPGHKTMIAALKHIAKTCGVAVVLMHHTSQAAANNLPELNISEADIRGGTTLVNNARQCLLLVNLASSRDPLPDTDARTALRLLAARGETDRVSALICLNTSKALDPPPIFFRWDDTGKYGPRLVELTPPSTMLGRAWRWVQRQLAGVRAEVKADKKAEAGQASVRLAVKAAAEIAEKGDQPTARKVSVTCGRSFTWAKPYLDAAVEQGLLVRSTEQVPRAVGLTDVYRPVDGALPWSDQTDD
jgi:AAA domain-containing protein/primase-like protein